MLDSRLDHLPEGSVGRTLVSLKLHSRERLPVDVVQRDLACNNDPPLNLADRVRHLLRDRYNEPVARALKIISSAGVMLRALCDPDAFTHDIMLNFHDQTALFVACQADKANVLGDGECDLRTIATKTGIEQDKISRYLNALTNLHIFREVAQDVYANNELSLLFRSKSKRALVGLCAEGRLSSCKAWEALTLPEFKGSNDPRKAGFKIAYQTDLNLYEWWERVRPDLGARGAQAFTGKGINHDQYLSLYPWAEERNGTLVVDVGGGAGDATLPILRRFPCLQLQVQDSPENEKNFHEFLEGSFPDILALGQARFLGQDIFDTQATKKANMCFLRHIIHNWQDPEATKILSHLAAAMSPTSKLVICEHIVMPTYQSIGDGRDEKFTAPEPLLPNWGATFTSRLDLQVLAVLNARERTVADFERLVAASGLRLEHVWRNMGDEVILECRLA